MKTTLIITPGFRQGYVTVPLSKSHLHRLLIADFLAGGKRYAEDIGTQSFSEDVNATRRCLAALANCNMPTLDCGESGSTLRFMLPVAMTQTNNAFFKASGRLPNRPIAPFLDLLRDHGVLSLTGTAFPLHLQGQLAAGHFAFPGDISSQIVTGLLFALPLLPDDSEIRWTTPLESSGYVDLTIQVLRHFGIHIDSVQGGFDVAGRQKYVSNASIEPEIDWSGAAFWLAMNALGSSIKLPKLNLESAQPDSAIVEILKHIGEDIDISQCPDSFPVLAVVAAATNKVTHFTNVKRLRYKESDRIAAMADMLNTLGVKTTESENDFTVFGQTVPLKGGSIIRTYDDHRIAMAAAVAATVADAPLTIDNSQCVSKSYEGFWKQFEDLDTL